MLGCEIINKIQRNVFFSFISLLIIQLMLIYVFDPIIPVRIFECTMTVGLFGIGFIIARGDREKYGMIVALFFSAAGDIFLVLMPKIVPGSAWELFGIGSFTLSYIFLIITYRKNGLKSVQEIWKAIPFLVSVIFFFAVSGKYIGTEMMVPAIIFSVVIITMAWSMVTLSVRGYFTKGVQKWNKYGAIILFVSDLAVAFNMFYPGLSEWSKEIELFIRVTYVPAWVLFVLAISEDDFSEE